MHRTSYLPASRTWKGFWLAGVVGLSLTAGCAAPKVVIVGRPAPVPEVSEATLYDVERLAHAWCRVPGEPSRPCLMDGDGLVDYLAEVERYRCYIAELRDEPLPECEEP